MALGSNPCRSRKCGGSWLGYGAVSFAMVRMTSGHRRLISLSASKACVDLSASDNE